MHAVAAGVGEPVIDYVRLNIVARRASGDAPPPRWRLAPSAQPSTSSIAGSRGSGGRPPEAWNVPVTVDVAPPHLLEVRLRGGRQRSERVRRHRAGESNAAAALRRVGLHEDGAQLGGRLVGQEVAGDANGLPVLGRGRGEQRVDIDGGRRVRCSPGATATAAPVPARRGAAAPAQAARIRPGRRRRRSRPGEVDEGESDMGSDLRRIRRGRLIARLDAARATGFRQPRTRNGPAVARDDDVGRREDPLPASLEGGLVGGVRVDLGRPVGAPPQVRHRVDAVVGLDDERDVLLRVAGRQPQLRVRGEVVAVAVVVEPQVVAVAGPEVDDLGIREERDVHRVVGVVVARGRRG